jgi:hypothetical protein
MKRRAAVEPVIGHVKAEHRMDRNYLKGRVESAVVRVLHGGQIKSAVQRQGYYVRKLRDLPI